MNTVTLKTIVCTVVIICMCYLANDENDVAPFSIIISYKGISYLKKIIERLFHLDKRKLLGKSKDCSYIEKRGNC